MRRSPARSGLPIHGIRTDAIGSGRNDDFIVACQGETPTWFWENKDGRWELNRLCVVRESDLSDTFDLAALLDDDEDLDHRVRNKPENLTPMALLGVVMYFAKTLMHAAAKVKNEPCFPDARDPDGDYCFREAGGLIVAYRGSEPVWALEKKGMMGHGSCTDWSGRKNQTCQNFQMTLHYTMASGLIQPVAGRRDGYNSSRANVAETGAMQAAGLKTPHKRSSAANTSREVNIMPFYQGEFDGLCGQYAIVNAFELCGCDPSDLFEEACRGLAHRRWPRVVHHFEIADRFL